MSGRSHLPKSMLPSISISFVRWYLCVIECYNNVTTLLQYCVTTLLQHCYNIVTTLSTTLLQHYYNFVTTLLQHCNNIITTLLQHCVTTLLQHCVTTVFTISCCTSIYKTDLLKSRMVDYWSITTYHGALKAWTQQQWSILYLK